MAERPRNTGAERDAEGVAAAQRDLARLGGEAEVIGTSRLAAVAGKAAEGVRPEDDSIEIWGRRIGRGLGFVAVIGLGAWLLATYVFV